MKPSDLPVRPTAYKHDRPCAESVAVDYINGLSYFELSKKYSVSEGTLGRILKRIYGKTSMPKKVRQTKQNLPPEVPTNSESLSPEEEIKRLKAELRKKEKKIHEMEYLVEVVGDYLGKDFGLPKKK